MYFRSSVISAATVALSLTSTASAALVGPGDLAFTGFDADTETFAIVLLKGITSSQVVRFRDDEWSGTQFVDSNEAAFSWTTPVTLAAGTVVRFSSMDSLTNRAVTAGSLAGEASSLGNSNEALFAYLGSESTPTSFLGAFGNDTVADTENVLTGTGLTNGTNAQFFSGDRDIFAYNASRSSQSSFADYRPSLMQLASFITGDGSGNQTVTTSFGTEPPFNTTAFVVPEPASLAVIGLAGLAMLRRRRA